MVYFKVKNACKFEYYMLDQKDSEFFEKYTLPQLSEIFSQKHEIFEMYSAKPDLGDGTEQYTLTTFIMLSNKLLLNYVFKIDENDREKSLQRPLDGPVVFIFKLNGEIFNFKLHYNTNTYPGNTVRHKITIMPNCNLAVEKYYLNLFMDDFFVYHKFLDTLSGIFNIKLYDKFAYDILLHVEQQYIAHTMMMNVVSIGDDNYKVPKKTMSKILKENPTTYPEILNCFKHKMHKIFPNATCIIQNGENMDDNNSILLIEK